MKQLSILICTLTERHTMLNRLLGVLRPQQTNQVEILIEEDQGQSTIGAKRNRLMSKAQGEYICFVDDDDLVSEDYVASLLNGIAQGVDVVAIQGIFTNDGNDPSPFYDCPYQGHGLTRMNGKTEFKRGVQHLDAIRRDIAITQQFPESSHGEDYDWGTKIERTHIIKTWHRVDHPVYFYDFRSAKPWSGRCDLAVVMPVYNHVYTTQKCVQSLLESTADANFCLIMVDDGSTDDTPIYARDLAEHLGSRFHYHQNATNIGVNASWNLGITIARARRAKYIAVVNNDLMFAPEWDKPLVASLKENPEVGIISPLSTYGPIPFDWPKGKYRDVNPAGYRGYMPILGACFMARVETFEAIGPIPADMRIYFGDNWLVVAAQKLGLECGYDDKSYIHHFLCVTTSQLQNESIWKEDGPAFDLACEKLGATMKPFAPKPADSPTMVLA